MSNDPNDSEADRLADQETDRDQDAMRLDDLSDDRAAFRVYPCFRETNGEIISACEVILHLGETPILDAARQLSELSRRCVELHRQDVERREAAAQETEGQ